MDIENLLLTHNRGKRLSLEFGTIALMEIDGVASATKAVFVGTDNRSYVILQISNPTALRSKLFIGNQVVVRYLYGGAVYGFQTVITGYYLERAFRLLFLSYPQVIEDRNIRKDERVPCYAPCFIIHGNQSFKGLISDISLGGCRVTIAQRNMKSLDVGEAIEISCGDILGLTEEGNMKAIVRNVTKDEDRMIIGVQFDDMNEGSRARIESYIGSVANVFDGHMFLD